MQRCMEIDRLSPTDLKTRMAVITNTLLKQTHKARHPTWNEDRIGNGHDVKICVFLFLQNNHKLYPRLQENIVASGLG